MVRNADGSITFTVNDMFYPAAATTALHNAGITGRAVILNDDPSCTTTSADINPVDLYPDGTNTRAFGNGPSTATFRSSDYPAGGGLLLVLIDRREPPRPGRPPVEELTPTVFVIAFDDAAKIPTCINPDIEPGTGG